MRKTILAAVGAFIIGGATTGALIAAAQPAPPPVPLSGPPPMHGPMMHGPMMGWMHREPGDRPFQRGTFALIYRAPDRHLSPADVQKIAEGVLLWRGKHTWKVTNVAPASDGAIGFSLTTPEGSVVAKFTMDPHTGHVTRVG
jgi:hypothetical protein